MSTLLNICEEAARGAADLLLGMRGSRQVRSKAPGDLVTDADLAAEKLIRRVILRDFPGHAIVGEEEGAIGQTDADHVWYVDPLDGTVNYVHGLRHFAVSVAVAKIEPTTRRPTLLAGVVFDPMADECFTAAAGEGARLNGQAIRTSDTQDLSEALVAISLPVRARRGQPAVELLLDMMPRCQGVRRLGSAALNMAYVAAGYFDAYWDVKTKPWDVAAGALLVTEAGGIVTGRDGGEFDLAEPRPIAAANATLHRQLLAVFAGGGEAKRE